MEILRIWKWVCLSLKRRWAKRPKIQSPDTSITVVLVQYHVKASYQEELVQVLSAYIFSCRRAVGNVMAEAYYELGDPYMMWIAERWTSDVHYNDNKNSTAARNISVLTKVGLVSPVETIFLEDLEMFFKDDSQKPVDKDQPTSIMLFVDVKPGSEDYFRSINRNAMTALRNNPGVLIFRLSQLSNNKTKFVIYKKFRNRDAFRHHLKAAELVPVIKFLQTSVKEPPFEKGYRHLIEFAHFFRE